MQPERYLCPVKYIFYAILLYLAFQFIFKLVIPVFIASRKIKKGFREMQQHMEEQMRQQQQHQSAQPSASPQKEKLGDYIEFEEVK